MSEIQRLVTALCICLWVCSHGISLENSQPGPPVEAPSLDLEGYDPENAEEILRNCAACHGEFGQGGGKGIYPRLAGLPMEYLARALRAYQSRQRLSIPMIPFVAPRELPPEDLRDICVMLSRIELQTVMPDLPEDMDAYERLLIAQRVINIPRLEGDLEAGEAIYKVSCAKCHGREGKGRSKVPPLTGQHTVYLRDQLRKFRTGERWHKKREKYMDPYSAEQFEDLLAFLTILDD